MPASATPTGETPHLKEGPGVFRNASADGAGVQLKVTNGTATSK